MNYRIVNTSGYFSKSAQQGLGIVEVMVSLLLLAIAVLGFSAMQTSAVKATSESVDRTEALAVMRSAAEKIRANSSALDSYKTEFNSLSSNIKSGSTLAVPTNRCGMDGSAGTKCTPADIAKSDVYEFYTKVKGGGFNMDMVSCPATGGTGTTASSSVMFSYCLIAAWDKTLPTKGSDDTLSSDTDTMDCISDTTGKYHPKSTCMFMEIN